jgi:hypothetical protein
VRDFRPPHCIPLATDACVNGMGLNE